MSSPSIGVVKASEWIAKGFVPVPLVKSSDMSEYKRPSGTGWNKRSLASFPSDLPAFESSENVGLLCGTNFDALDFDYLKAPEGPGRAQAEALAALFLPGGPYHGKYTVVETPKGGVHVWFAPIKDLKNGVKVDKTKDFEGCIDIRTTGGQVVAPGTTAPDGSTYRYLVEATGPLCEAPVEVMDVLIKGKCIKMSPKDAMEHFFKALERKAPKEVTDTFITIDEEAEYVKKCVEKSPQFAEKMVNWSFRGRIGASNMFIWDRLKPSPCEFDCDRVHEHDNTFMAKITEHGVIYAFCERQKDDYKDHKYIQGRANFDVYGIAPKTEPFTLAALNREIERITRNVPFPKREDALVRYLNRYFIRRAGSGGGITFWRAETQTHEFLTKLDIETIVGGRAAKHIFKSVVYNEDEDGTETEKNVKVTVNYIDSIFDNPTEAQVVWDFDQPPKFTRFGIHYINLFHGLQFLNVNAESPESDEDLQVVLDHIREVLCSGNKDQYEYFLNLQACLVRCKRTEKVVCLQGRQGVGKSMFTNFLINHVIGQENAQEMSSPDHITGKFNALCAAKLLLVVDDPNMSGADEWHKFGKAIKDMATAERLTIEKKYKEAVPTLNRVNIFICSNDSVMSVPTEDRRIFMPDVIRDRLPTARMHRLAKALVHRGPSTGVAYGRFLLARDLSDFDMYTEPLVTRTKKTAMRYAIPSHQLYLAEKLLGALRDGTSDIKEGVMAMYAGYKSFLSESGIEKKKPPTRAGFIEEMKTIGFTFSVGNHHHPASLKMCVEDLKKRLIGLRAVYEEDLPSSA
jgi:hypothetical protein